ncbi:hypothetical protein Pmani_000916 [Petrolisthes manimaculis]|uniref:Uncharacterized protein n=1 Tax=Petrolisthes manimaculis TaxID=1843537 RepID=A0AAE1QLL6_9EUCA|nr:hypothetical protein Pmani_000916 [Petrolisthes manimaculis]
MRPISKSIPHLPPRIKCLPRHTPQAVGSTWSSPPPPRLKWSTSPRLKHLSPITRLKRLTTNLHLKRRSPRLIGLPPRPRRKQRSPRLKWTSPRTRLKHLPPSCLSKHSCTHSPPPILTLQHTCTPN